MLAPASVLAMALEDIRVASPCSADWSAMPGDNQMRTCGDCKKRVYNLTAMTRAEAEALISSHENPCVRLYRRRDGTVVTADCAPRLHKIRRRVLAGAFAALAGGCVDDSMDPGTDETAEAEEQVGEEAAPLSIDDAKAKEDQLAKDLAEEGYTLTMGASISIEYIVDEVPAPPEAIAAVESESTEE
jgi:hypothetical protein